MDRLSAIKLCKLSFHQSYLQLKLEMMTGSLVLYLGKSYGQHLFSDDSSMHCDTTYHSNDQEDDQCTIGGSQGEVLMIALHCSLRHIGSPKYEVSSAYWVIWVQMDIIIFIKPNLLSFSLQKSQENPHLSFLNVWNQFSI